jgi:hypothetical protein
MGIGTEKIWITFWSMIGAVICSIIISITVYHVVVTKDAFKNGYEEAQKFGTCGTYWKAVK